MNAKVDLEKQVRQLQSGDGRQIMEALRDIQTILAGSNFLRQQEKVLDQVPLELFFSCFDTRTLDQLELICKVGKFF